MSVPIKLALEAIAYDAEFCTFVNFNDWHLPKPWEYAELNIMIVTGDDKYLEINEGFKLALSDITNIELYFTPLADGMCAVLEYGKNEDMIKFYRTKPS